MEKDSRYRFEAQNERSVLHIVRRDGPVAVCDLPLRWVNSLLRKGYIKQHPEILSFVEITEKGEKYFIETM